MEFHFPFRLHRFQMKATGLIMMDGEREGKEKGTELKIYKSFGTAAKSEIPYCVTPWTVAVSAFLTFPLFPNCPSKFKFLQAALFSNPISTVDFKF